MVVKSDLLLTGFMIWSILISQSFSFFLGKMRAVSLLSLCGCEK